MTQHSVLGASSSHRWMKCAGSVRLSADQPDTSSIYAMEGTAAHEVAEQCLRDGVDADLYIGQTIHVVDQSDPSGETQVPIEVTADMVEAVQVYLDYIRETAGSLDLHIEVRVSLADVKPEDVDVDMFGTVDCAFYDEDERHLHVNDYKHGRGTVVEVPGNTQCLYYALGAILKLRKRPDKITTTIVQPRAPHTDGPVRSFTYTWGEIIEFKDAVMAAAQRAMAPDAPVGPVGDHCKFCPAMAVCPAQHENALSVAGDEFGTALETLEGADPGELTEGQFLQILEAADAIEDYLRAVRERAHMLLEQGVDVPGWKLVAKRATRRWADEETAAKYLQRKLGKKGAYNLKLLSPAQAEKALRRDDAGFDEHYLDRLIESKSSGTNLARESSPKPAVVPALEAADEFAEVDDE